MGKIGNRFLLAFGGVVFLGFIVHPGPAPAYAQNPNLVFDPMIEAQLQRIGGLIAERKSDAEILKAWEGFVDQSRRTDYAGCIRFVFENAKSQAETKARLAQLQIYNAGELAKAVAAELDLIRRRNTSINRGIPPGSIPRKRFEMIRNSNGRFVVRIAGFISSKKELDEYEGYIQSTGREANLQGTGGVALLEFAKDAIQTAVSNISGAGTMQCRMKKIAERKMNSQG